MKYSSLLVICMCFVIENSVAQTQTRNAIQCQGVFYTMNGELLNTGYVDFHYDLKSDNYPTGNWYYRIFASEKSFGGFKEFHEIVSTSIEFAESYYSDEELFKGYESIVFFMQDISDFGTLVVNFPKSESDSKVIFVVKIGNIEAKFVPTEFKMCLKKAGQNQTNTLELHSESTSFKKCLREFFDRAQLCALEYHYGDW